MLIGHCNFNLEMSIEFKIPPWLPSQGSKFIVMNNLNNFLYGRDDLFKKIVSVEFKIFINNIIFCYINRKLDFKKTFVNGTNFS